LKNKKISIDFRRDFEFPSMAVRARRAARAPPGVPVEERPVCPSRCASSFSVLFDNRISVDWAVNEVNLGDQVHFVHRPMSDPVSRPV